MGDLRQAEFAYFAGLFDGEGTITMYWTKRKGYKDGFFLGNLSLSNTDVPVIQCLQMYFGGSVYLRPKRFTYNKPIYIWQAFGHKSVEILRHLYPYLVIKKQLAEDYFEFWSTVDHAQRHEIIRRYRARQQPQRLSGMTFQRK